MKSPRARSNSYVNKALSISFFAQGPSNTSMNCNEIKTDVAAYQLITQVVSCKGCKEEEPERANMMCSIGLASEEA